MGMTLTEKILARHAGKDVVAPGELILAKVDLALGNDVTSPIAIDAVRKLGVREVFDRERIALVPEFVLGEFDTLPTPGMSWICRFTEMVPRSQSMSAHLSPRSSESLIPVTIAR